MCFKQALPGKCLGTLRAYLETTNFMFLHFSQNVKLPSAPCPRTGNFLISNLMEQTNVTVKVPVIPGKSHVRQNLSKYKRGKVLLWKENVVKIY